MNSGVWWCTGGPPWWEPGSCRFAVLAQVVNAHVPASKADMPDVLFFLLGQGNLSIIGGQPALAVDNANA